MFPDLQPGGIFDLKRLHHFMVKSVSQYRIQLNAGTSNNYLNPAFIRGQALKREKTVMNPPISKREKSQFDITAC